jgi:hypothetical protein
LRGRCSTSSRPTASATGSVSDRHVRTGCAPGRVPAQDRWTAESMSILERRPHGRENTFYEVLDRRV